MTKLPSAKIRDSLEQRIIEGELGIGKRLDEAELSAHYGVSRTPVREALQRLAESGLAEHLPRRGTFVRAPSLAELVEMFEVMAELECMSVRLATRRAAGLVRVGQCFNVSAGRAAGGKPHGHTFQLCHHFKHFDKF